MKGYGMDKGVLGKEKTWAESNITAWRLERRYKSQYRKKVVLIMVKGNKRKSREIKLKENDYNAMRRRRMNDRSDGRDKMGNMLAVHIKLPPIDTRKSYIVHVLHRSPYTRILLCSHWMLNE